MNICSCVVHTRPERAAEVSARLLTIPGVEVHGGEAEGKLVVTVEDTADTLAADTLGAIGAVEGVINTVLIYHYGGDDIEQSLAEEGNP
jgi:nitrate reductase NapD